jgi:hypothetical protein
MPLCIPCGIHIASYTSRGQPQLNLTAITLTCWKHIWIDFVSFMLGLSHLMTTLTADKRLHRNYLLGLCDRDRLLRSWSVSFSFGTNGIRLAGYHQHTHYSNWSAASYDISNTDHNIHSTFLHFQDIVPAVVETYGPATRKSYPKTMINIQDLEFCSSLVAFFRGLCKPGIELRDDAIKDGSCRGYWG